MALCPEVLVQLWNDLQEGIVLVHRERDALKTRVSWRSDRDTATAAGGLTHLLSGLYRAVGRKVELPNVNQALALEDARADTAILADLEGWGRLLVKTTQCSRAAGVRRGQRTSQYELPASSVILATSFAAGLEGLDFLTTCDDSPSLSESNWRFLLKDMVGGVNIEEDEARREDGDGYWLVRRGCRVVLGSGMADMDLRGN